MSVQIIAAERVVCAKLCGDIDHHTAREMRCEIDVAVRENVPTPPEKFVGYP